MRPNSDKAKTGRTIPSPVADFVEISRHRSAMDPSGPGIGADALALIKSHHQEGCHAGERHGRAQIGRRLERPQEGPDGSLVVLRYGRVRSQICS
jgi:hypothetical protein